MTMKVLVDRVGGDDFSHFDVCRGLGAREGGQGSVRSGGWLEVR